MTHLNLDRDGSRTRSIITVLNTAVERYAGAFPVLWFACLILLIWLTYP